MRDEKAQLSRRLHRLRERLHQRTAQLEELSARLREFEDGRQAVDRRLEAAKHQIEVQEALGPQVLRRHTLVMFLCLHGDKPSPSSVEDVRMRSRQKASLSPRSLPGL